MLRCSQGSHAPNNCLPSNNFCPSLLYLLHVIIMFPKSGVLQFIQPAPLYNNICQIRHVLHFVSKVDCWKNHTTWKSFNVFKRVVFLLKRSCLSSLVWVSAPVRFECQDCLRRCILEFFFLHDDVPPLALLF